MDNIFKDSVRYIRSLFPNADDSTLQLPNCGVYALHDAHQRPVKRRRSSCSMDSVRQLCNDKNAQDRFLYSLSGYCKHDSVFTAKLALLGESDYHKSIRILKHYCPSVDTKHVELRKRQATTALPTSTIRTTAAPTATLSTVSSVQVTVITPSTAAVPSSSGPVAGSSQSGVVVSGNIGSSSVPLSNAPSASVPAISAGTSIQLSTSGAAVASSLSGSAGASSASSGAAKGSSVSSSAATSAAAMPPVPPKTTFSVASSDFSSIPVASFAVQSSPAPNPVAALPTSTFYGQQLLTSSCAKPQYTAMQLKDGSYNVAPIIGCAEANPNCCPSLTKAADASAPSVTASFIPLSEANSALVSALNAAPLTVCPADYISVSGNCCPYGFNLWTQEVQNQTPCFSVLPQTVSVPDAVSQEILALSKAMQSTATAQATLSVHLITDQVFALSLPVRARRTGLAPGAIIGIGVGCGILGLLLLVGGFFACKKFRKNRRVKRRKNNDKEEDGNVQQQAGHQRVLSNDSEFGYAPTAVTDTSAKHRSLASTVTAMGSPSFSPAKPGVQPYSDYGAEQQGQYYRTPPPRHPLEPTTVYSELPGGEARYPVETDGREMGAWEAQQHGYGQQGYGQQYHPQHGAQPAQELPTPQSSYGQPSPYSPPPAELDHNTPRPRWMN